LAILSASDAVAQELNKEKTHLSRNANSMEEESSSNFYPLVFSELLVYITEAKLNSEGRTVFRLAELVDLYKQRLQQLGFEAPNVNSTKLKEKISKELPELEAHKKGRDVLLAFQDDVGLALSESCASVPTLMPSFCPKLQRSSGVKCLTIRFVLDRVRHFRPIPIHRFFAVNRYQSDTNTLQEQPWRSVTDRSKPPDAAATNNSGGGQRGGRCF